MKQLETEACSQCSRSRFTKEKQFHDNFICSTRYASLYKSTHKVDVNNPSKWEKKLLDEMVYQGDSTQSLMDEASKLELEINELFNKSK